MGNKPSSGLTWFPQRQSDPTGCEPPRRSRHGTTANSAAEMAHPDQDAAAMMPECAVAADSGPAQIDRLAAIVLGAVDRELRARALHVGAAQRIDAALYELDRLREELSGVVSPALLSPAAANGDFGPRGNADEVHPHARQGQPLAEPMQETASARPDSETRGDRAARARSAA